MFLHSSLLCEAPSFLPSTNPSTFLPLTEEAVIHERATCAISSLAEDFSLKIQLNQGGAVQPLLRMLHSPTSETQRNSAKALELLTRHYQCRTALVEAEGEREQGGGKGGGA